MATDLMRDLREVLPASGLEWREAGALSWLAEGASTDTGLTWQGYKTLIGLVRCGKNMIGPALNRLAANDRISILSRAGRVQIYLVHPKGIASVAPLTAGTVRHHLAKGRFSEGDIAVALAWLAGLGVLASADALALAIGESKSNKRREGVPTAGTPVKDRPKSHQPPPLEGHPCPCSGDGGVPSTGNEPEENRKRTESAGTRPANMGRLAGPSIGSSAEGTWDWATPAILAEMKAQPPPKQGA